MRLGQVPGLIALLLFFICAGCMTRAESQASIQRNTPFDPAIIPPRDAGLPAEALNEEDIITDSSLDVRFHSIRENFKRINSITEWSRVDAQPQEGTTEGGEAKYYYLKGRLEKIVTREYGEMYQSLTEYYLLEGTLSFVFEKEYRYNRPMYYDSAAMEE